MTGTGFTEWYAEAAVSGLYGQPARTIAELAFEAGYAARKSAEFSMYGISDVAWDEVRDIFRADYSHRGKSDLTADEIKRIFAPPQPFQGRTDPDYEVPGPKLTDEDVRNVKDSLAPGLLPGMTAAQEAYDRHFGAPGPVPTAEGVREGLDHAAS